MPAVSRAILWLPQEQWQMPAVPREHQPVSDPVTGTTQRRPKVYLDNGTTPVSRQAAPALPRRAICEYILASDGTPLQGAPGTTPVSKQAVTIDRARKAPALQRRAMRAFTMSKEAPVYKGAATGQVTDRATAPVSSTVPAVWHSAARSWLRPPAPNWRINPIIPQPSQLQETPEKPSPSAGFQGSHQQLNGSSQKPSPSAGFQGSHQALSNSSSQKSSINADFRQIPREQTPLAPEGKSSTNADFQGSSNSQLSHAPSQANAGFQGSNTPAAQGSPTTKEVNLPVHSPGAPSSYSQLS